jgi:hypothetical protein
MKAMIVTRVRLDRAEGAAGRGRIKAMLAVPAVFVLAGCIQLSAPEKPIEINLNINIRQEVVVRLQQDVRELIEKNPGVF